MVEGSLSAGSFKLSGTAADLLKTQNLTITRHHRDTLRESDNLIEQYEST